MRTLLLLVAITGLTNCGPQESAAPAPVESNEVQGVHRDKAGQPAPDIPYLGPDGDEARLSDYRGPLLVNFWATWCAPCVKELPTLDALARKHAATGDLEVIAMNQDRAPQGSLEAFYVNLKINGLGLEQDPDMRVAGALGISVLPTTVLFDDGKEVWRYVGDLDWTSAEAAKLLSEAR